jgi:Flp pilus assembly protein TadD
MHELKAKVLALLDQQLYQEAQHVLAAFQPGADDSAMVFYLHGLLAYQQGQLPHALTYLHHAKALAGDNKEISLSLAAVLCESGDYQQAEKIFTEVLPDENS